MKCFKFLAYPTKQSEYIYFLWRYKTYFSFTKINNNNDKNNSFLNKKTGA